MAENNPSIWPAFNSIVEYFFIFVNLILTAELNMFMLSLPRVGLGAACST
jgi:hypothetical protein